MNMGVPETTCIVYYLIFSRNDFLVGPRAILYSRILLREHNILPDACAESPHFLRMCDLYIFQQRSSFKTTVRYPPAILRDTQVGVAM